MVPFAICERSHDVRVRLADIIAVKTLMKLKGWVVE